MSHFRIVSKVVILAIVSAMFLVSVTACTNRHNNGSGALRMQQYNKKDMHADTLQHNTVTPGINEKSLHWHQAADVRENRMLEDEVSMMGGVHFADIFVSGNKAYVAVVPHGPANVPFTPSKPKYVAGENRLPPIPQQKIVRRVKKLDPGIKYVYVSGDPAFVAKMEQFKGNVRTGTENNDFLTRFSNTMARQFPLQP